MLAQIHAEREETADDESQSRTPDSFIHRPRGRGRGRARARRGRRRANGVGGRHSSTTTQVNAAEFSFKFSSNTLCAQRTVKDLVRTLQLRVAGEVPAHRDRLAAAAAGTRILLGMTCWRRLKNGNRQACSRPYTNACSPSSVPPQPEAARARTTRKPARHRDRVRGSDRAEPRAARSQARRGVRRKAPWLEHTDPEALRPPCGGLDRAQVRFQSDLASVCGSAAKARPCYGSGLPPA
jgi:hypothetical protein